MPRLRDLTPNEMSVPQRAVFDATVAGRRGMAPANVMTWLRSPELASRGQRLGEFLRYDTTLPPRLSELAILVVARHWTAQYEWAVHHAEATRAGVPAHAIDAIAEGRLPELETRGERAVWSFSTALLETHGVPDHVYGETVAALGEQAVVELVGVLGYYTLVAMTLNAFQVDPPPGGAVLRPAARP